MSSAGSFAAKPPAIATRAELDHLVETRPQPAPQRHLTPDGMAAPSIQDRLRAMRETRIGELQDRLQNARQGLEWGHASAQMQDKAKVEFERSR